MNFPTNYQAGTKGVIHAAAVNGQDNNGNTLCRPAGQRPGTILFEVEASVTCKSCLKAIARAEAEAYAEYEPIAFTRAESAKVEEMRDSGALAEGLAAAKARSEARAEADAASDPLMVLLDDTTPMPADSSELADLAALETTVEDLAGSVHVTRDGGLIITAGAPEPKPDAGVAQEIDDAFAELENLERRRAAVVGLATGLTYGATIRPKAWVTAHVDSESLSSVAARVHTTLTDTEVTRALRVVTQQAAAGTLVAKHCRTLVRSSGRVAGRLLAASKSGQRRPTRSRRG